MRKETILLTASENVGVGLWTSICIAFASIFGVKSRSFNRKLNRVMKRLKEDLYDQMDDYPGYDFSDFRIVRDGSLAYTASVIGVGIPSLPENDDEEYLDEENASNVEKEEDDEIKKIVDEAIKLHDEEKDTQKAFELFNSVIDKSARAKFYIGYYFLYLGKHKKDERIKGLELIKESARDGYSVAADKLDELGIDF